MQKCYEHMGSVPTWVAEQTNTHDNKQGERQAEMFAFFLDRGVI